MSRLRSGILPCAALLLLLASLWLMSNATQGSARFDRLYSVLLVINVAGLITLGALIVHNLHRLLRQVRERQPGARLTGRMAAVFVALAVIPVIVVYAFSLQFLSRGIDTWFDVRIEQALDDALDLGRASLDARMRDLLQRTRVFATDLADTKDEDIALRPGRRTALERCVRARPDRPAGPRHRVQHDGAYRPRAGPAERRRAEAGPARPAATSTSIRSAMPACTSGWWCACRTRSWGRRPGP